MSTHYVTLMWEFIRDKKTSMHEKLVFAEICQLSTLDKGCIASNNHFAELLGVKKEAVSRTIKSLENKGYIQTKIKGGSRNMDRSIFINKMLLNDNKMLSNLITKCLESKETIRKTNKRENKNTPNSPPNLNQKAWDKWIDFKKQIKNNYKTVSGEEQKMRELAVLDSDTQMKCVDYSIGNEYKGLFPDKFQEKEKPKSGIREEIMRKLQAGQYADFQWRCEKAKAVWMKGAEQGVSWHMLTEYQVNQQIGGLM